MRVVLPPDAASNDSPCDFLAGGGEMGALIRDFDWASTSLGAIAAWPQSLRTAVDLVVHCPVPMALLWGPDSVMIYNDRYAAVAGGRRPQLLGAKLSEAWPEVADFNRRVMAAEFAGETVSLKEQHLVLNRHGVPDDPWMDLDYSPIRDESGRPAGVLAVVIETTDRVRTERRLQFQLDLAERLRSIAEPAEVRVAAAEALGRHLGVARVGYAEVEADDEHILVERDWTDGTTLSVAGRYRMDDFGPPIIAELKAGRTVRVDDVTVDPRTAGAGVEAFAAIDCRTALAIPLIKKGRLAALLYLQDPKPRHWTDADAALAEDVTERTWSALEQASAEAALRESEARFRAMADSAPAPVFVTHAEGGVAFVNRSFVEFAGRRAEDLLGNVWTSIIHPDDLPAVAQKRAQAWADHSPYEFEARFKGARGEYLWMLTSARPRFDGAGAFQGYVGMAVDLTERRQAEADLRVANAALSKVNEQLAAESDRLQAVAAEQAAILGQLGEGVIVTDPDGRITFVNDAAARLHGVARLDVAPEKYAETYHLLTEDGQPYPSEDLPLARAVRTGEAVADARWRIRRPDGSEVLAIGSARPVVSGEGRQIGSVLTVRDDTERMAAEQAVAESEQRFRDLADNMPTLCWTAYADGNIFWYNRRWHDYTGTTSEDHAGWGWQSVHDPDVLPRVVERWQRSLDNGEPFEMTFPLKAADGSFRPFLTRVVPIRGGDGAIVRWFGTNTDIKDQVAAEEALRESEQRFRLMADSAPALIWATDADARVIFVNRRYETELGIAPEAILRDGSRQFVHGDDADAYFAAFERAFETRQQFQREVRVWDKQRRLRWLRCEGVPRFNGAGEFLGYVGCNVDITEARLAADELEAIVEERTEELQAAEESLRQAQKMEAVGQLTGGIAHDFNNLLTAVVGGLDMIQRRSLDERTQRLAANAMQAAERGAKLTSQLLAFSRTQRLAVEPVDVNAAIERMGELLAGAVGSTIRLTVALEPDAGAALTDANQLELAILNLAINARDAVDGAGAVTVSTSLKQVGGGAPAVAGLSPGDYVVVAVADDGPGMPADVVARAFDPFYTTKAVGQGTGLGLSQVYGIARQSGGVAVIESKPGLGATVSIYLPSSGGEAAAAKAAPGRILEIRGEARGVVLVIDDDPDVRRLIVDSLDSLGFRVLEAPDGPSGLDIFDKERPDLLLLDFAMPGMNGAEVAERARRVRPEQRVLFATGYADTQAIEQAAGDAAVLRKPFRLTDLAAAVEGALAD